MSCDSCSRRKLSCDTKKPCMRCRSGNIICTYERLKFCSSSATAHTGLDAKSSGKANGNPKATASGKDKRISIEFLLNFTDPSGYRQSAAIAAEAADIISVEDAVDFHVRQIYLEDPLAPLDQLFCDTGGFDPMYTRYPSLMSREDQSEVCTVLNGSSVLDQEETSALEGRIEEVVSLLFAQQSLMGKCDSCVQANFDMSLANVVFTVANVQHFIWSFFHYFHDQLPIFHRPTFDIRTLSLPLLLTLTLFGSISCNPSDMSIAMQQFFDVAEAYVYDQLTSGQMRRCSVEADITNDDVELLQAGLLFLILRNNSNDLMTRRRIRLRRIPSLVAAVRLSGLFAYKRQHPVTNTARLEWRLFISEEVRVRY